MFSLRYLTANPSFLTRFEEEKWEELMANERRAAAELSFLFDEMWNQQKKSAANRSLDPSAFGYYDMWHDAKIPGLSYATHSVIASGQSEKKLNLSFELGRMLVPTTKPCIFGGIGHKQLNPAGIKTLKSDYLTVLSETPTAAVNDPRIILLSDPEAMCMRLKNEKALTRIVVDLSGDWEADDHEPFLNLCHKALDFLFAEAKRMGLLLVGEKAEAPSVANEES
jgi:hypothetical protein